MPSFADLLSQQLNNPANPGDQLRLAVGQDQGANLAGAPQANPTGMPALGAPPGSPQAMPGVIGPLAALANPLGRNKPRIKLKVPPAAMRGKPRIKLKLPLGGP